MFFMEEVLGIFFAELKAGAVEFCRLIAASFVLRGVQELILWNACGVVCEIV